MSDRPEYRTLYTTFADDIDVHAMTPVAFKLFILLKVTLPPTGLGVIYPSKLCDQVGVDRAQLDLALVELETPKPGREGGWIRRDRTIVWVVNAFACEPGMTPTNKNHVKYVRRLVAGVDSRSPIVAEFRDLYRAWFQGDTKPIPKGSPNPSGKGSKGDGESHADHKQRTSNELDKTQQSGDLDQERGTPAPPAPRFASLAELLAASAAVDEFCRTYYPRSRADRARRDDIGRQLLATLDDGAPFESGRVFAYTLDRLEAKCRDVLAEAIRDPDKAIVVLLKKLGDTSDGSAPGQVAAAAEARDQQRDAGEIQRELASAHAWLADHPDRVAAIDEQLVRDGFPTDLTDDTHVVGRRIAREALVLRTYRQSLQENPHQE